MSRLWARDGALQTAANAALLVLDIDGVLLDPRPSFYEAAHRTAIWAAQRILARDPGARTTEADVAAFKNIGGWNDDFDLACGLAWGVVIREAGHRRLAVTEVAAHVGGGLPSLKRLLPEVVPEDIRHHGVAACSFTKIRARAAATYSGTERCLAMYGIDPAEHEGVDRAGLWPTEPVLCDARALAQVTTPLAFFTGRNVAEAALALERFNLSIPMERQSVDDGTTPRKPSPAGLMRLAQGLSGPLVFVGDSIDDQRAALAYRSIAEAQGGAPIVFVRVLDDLERARAEGADIVVPSLDVLLEAL